MIPDRIEKTALLHAPLERVWRAVSDAREFGSWFGVAFDGPFVAGRAIAGRIVPTTADADVAKLQEPHTGKRFEFHVEAMEPPRLIAFRWHPYAMDPSVDYTREPTTLIVFELTPVGNDTRLSIVESGFDDIPLSRRSAAFTANDGGWTHQLRLVANYLATSTTG
ncbi:MAG: SRPBCC family protein [Gammaproteobacteria bacterium]